MGNERSEVIVAETERLVLREIVEDDAPFILELLNTPSFVKYIGDRGVLKIDDARNFIENRYRQSYREHGYGMFTVEQQVNGKAIGICGFVRRDTLPGPDLGFAFLPEYEGKGFGYESASAIMDYGRKQLGFERVYAITSLDNQISCKLLTKLGFYFERLIEMPDGQRLKLFLCEISEI